MRLGQLARKLDVSTSQIIEFLSDEDQTDIEGNNTKLSEDQIALVTSVFDTQLTEEIIAKKEDSASDEKADHKNIPELDDSSNTENISVPDAIIEEIVENESDVVEVEVEPELELIKAPKVELAGLKIVGKIDLPEPKIEEAEAEAEAEEEEEEDEEEDEQIAEEKANTSSPGSENIDSTNGKPAKIQETPIKELTDSEKIYAKLRKRSNNPVIEARRKKERAEKRKKERIELEKKKIKTSHYKKHHAKSIAPRVVVYEEPEEEFVEEIIEKPKSKNWFARIWSFLDAK